MKKISASIITYNEEENIQDCLKSLEWVDEVVVVVDAHSSDATVRICEQFGARVFLNAWPGYVKQRNYALEKTTHEWTLYLDADERITPALRKEILHALNTCEDSCSGFKIPMRTYYLGRWLKHGDRYPSYKLRLFNKNYGRWHGRHVHESVHVDGSIRYLTEPIFHYSYKGVGDHLLRVHRYAGLKALENYEQGLRFNPLYILLGPVRAFLRTYLLRKGFLDGIPGFFIAAADAYYIFLMHATIWEMENTSKQTGAK